MSATIVITSPSSDATFQTSAASLLIGGTSNMMVFTSPQQVDLGTGGGEDVMTPLCTYLNQSDGLTVALAASLDPTRWTLRGADDNLYVGHTIIWLAFDEIQVKLNLVGGDPDPQSVNLVSYDGVPVESWTPLGVGLQSFTDGDDGQGDGRSATLTYRGELTNSAGGPTPLDVSAVGGGTGGAWQSDEPVALELGENTIEVFAIDDQLNEVSDTIAITRLQGGGISGARLATLVIAMRKRRRVKRT